MAKAASSPILQVIAARGPDPCLSPLPERFRAPLPRIGNGVRETLDFLLLHDF
jgi:hypothetical protein